MAKKMAGPQTVDEFYGGLHKAIERGKAKDAVRSRRISMMLGNVAITLPIVLIPVIITALISGAGLGQFALSFLLSWLAFYVGMVWWMW